MAAKSMSLTPSRVLTFHLPEGPPESSIVRMPFQVLARIGSFLSDQENARFLTTRKNLLNCHILQISPEIMAMVGSYLSPSENGRLLITCHHFISDSSYRGEIEAIFRMAFRAETDQFFAGLMTSLVTLSLFKSDVKNVTDALELSTAQRTKDHIHVIVIRLFFAMGDGVFSRQMGLESSNFYHFEFVEKLQIARKIRTDRLSENYQIARNLLKENMVYEAAELVMAQPDLPPGYRLDLVEGFCKINRLWMAMEFTELLSVEEQQMAFEKMVPFIIDQTDAPRVLEMLNKISDLKRRDFAVWGASRYLASLGRGRDAMTVAQTASKAHERSSTINFCIADLAKLNLFPVAIACSIEMEDAATREKCFENLTYYANQLPDPAAREQTLQDINKAKETVSALSS